MRTYKKPEKSRMVKRILAGVLAGLMTVTLLSGCRYRITDKSVEEEVAEAIAEYEAQRAAEEEARKAEEAAAEAASAADEAPELDPDTLVKAEEVVEPDKILMSDSELDSVSMTATEADSEGNVETHIEDVPEEEDTLQIVFLGDSIFDSVRDETGIAHIVGTEMGADIYNLSIGGTSCALRMDKVTSLSTWNEPSFMGMVYAMENKVDRGFLDGYKAGEVMSKLDPSKTDYFIIEYGTNDFLSYIPINAQDIHQQYYFYFVPSYMLGIKELKANYPDAKIILCTPYYEQFWSADRTRYIGDAHMTNNGFGTLMDYINAVDGVAAESGVDSLNMYNLLGVDLYSIDKMTEDGIHPNAEARAKYAEILCEKINEMEYGIVPDYVEQAEAETDAGTEADTEAGE